MRSRRNASCYRLGKIRAYALDGADLRRTRRGGLSPAGRHAGFRGGLRGTQRHRRICSAPGRRRQGRLSRRLPEGPRQRRLRLAGAQHGHRLAASEGRSRHLLKEAPFGVHGKLLPRHPRVPRPVLRMQGRATGNSSLARTEHDKRHRRRAPLLQGGRDQDEGRGTRREAWLPGRLPQLLGQRPQHGRLVVPTPRACRRLAASRRGWKKSPS